MPYSKCLGSVWRKGRGQSSTKGPGPSSQLSFCVSHKAVEQIKMEDIWKDPLGQINLLLQTKDKGLQDEIHDVKQTWKSLTMQVEKIWNMDWNVHIWSQHTAQNSRLMKNKEFSKKVNLPTMIFRNRWKKPASKQPANDSHAMVKLSDLTQSLSLLFTLSDNALSE